MPETWRPKFCRHSVVLVIRGDGTGKSIGYWGGVAVFVVGIMGVCDFIVASTIRVVDCWWARSQQILRSAILGVL